MISYFYPRPPRGGRLSDHSPGLLLFSISIHALREEGDGNLCEECLRENNFYPRPPRGGRQQPDENIYEKIQISIHALREEGDHDYFTSCLPSPIFLSTPSARRATMSRMVYK